MPRLPTDALDFTASPPDTSRRGLLVGASALICGNLWPLRYASASEAAASASTAPAKPTAATAAGPGTSAPAAADIVARADAIRFPRESFQVEVRVESTADGVPQEPRLYRLYSRGSDDTIIQTLEPATERGQNLLMSGRQLYAFLPNVSQPVRLSLSQRLTGQVANGDLARTDLAGDYTATLAGTEAIGGATHYVLTLEAAERGVTYPGARYWVRTADFHPHKAEFYSRSGRLLKTCHFEAFGRLGNRVRPTRLVMRDALKPGDVSVLHYANLELVDLPKRMFTKQYLKRLD